MVFHKVVAKMRPGKSFLPAENFEISSDSRLTTRIGIRISNHARESELSAAPMFAHLRIRHYKFGSFCVFHVLVALIFLRLFCVLYFNYLFRF